MNRDPLTHRSDSSCLDRAPLGRLAELGIVVALFGLALAVRWPELLTSPQFPSVGDTVLLALDLSAGRSFPLADQAPYLGALFIYLLAGLYRLVGSSVESTLLLPWALGGLTAVPTYLLGRRAGGRLAGLVAGALLATSAAHTVISSHVPLSHSLTPLLSTTTLWLLLRFATGAGGRTLALAGLAGGLALQTHPTVAPLLAGAAGAALLGRRDCWRTRWPALALGLLLLGYGNLLVDQLRTRLAVVSDIQGKQARYLDAEADPGEDAEQSVYLRNLEQLGLSLVRLSSGALVERETAADYLADPGVVVYPLLGALGLVGAIRRGRWVLPAATLAAVLLPPLLNGKYKPILDGRYLMPLVPVLFVGIGLACAAAVRLAVPAVPRPARLGLIGLLAGLAVLHPLALLGDFYEESQEDGFSNARYLQTLGQLRAARRDDEPVLLDSRLWEVKSTGGGKAGTSFTWLLAVSRIPSEPWEADGDRAPLVGRLAILQRDSAARLAPGLLLSPLDGERQRNGRSQQAYRAYRVGDG